MTHGVLNVKLKSKIFSHRIICEINKTDSSRTEYKRKSKLTTAVQYMKQTKKTVCHYFVRTHIILEIKLEKKNNVDSNFIVRKIKEKLLILYCM